MGTTAGNTNFAQPTLGRGAGIGDVVGRDTLENPGCGQLGKILNRSSLTKRTHQSLFEMSQSLPLKIFRNGVGLPTWHFTQLGGNSRLVEMILARVSSGFAGEKVWDDIQVVTGFLLGRERRLFGGSHKANECELNNPSEQGNNERKEKGEDIPEWTIRSKFEDKLSNFILEKKFHIKGIGDMFVQHRKGLREQYSQILSAINKSKTPKLEAPTLAITTRSGISTRDPPFLTPPRPATNSFIEEETKKKPEGTETSTIQEPVPRSSILYQPLKTSNPPFPSRLKKQKTDDEDERLLLIFKQIHINLPFLKVMIHMPKGAKVLKDLLSHKEKLKKVASTVKLSEECSTIIQKNLPPKEGDPGSFTLPCLIGSLAVKNALADLGASINLMPHSLFQ
ncbi:hypothetical protein Tco_0163853 [Tanacetum coccineum]